MSLKQNIIYIYFKGKHQVISKSQYQYNRGQYLYFVDLNLPQAFEVHFSNKDKGASKTQIGSNNLVEIPDEYFWNGALQIYAWIYLHSETNDGETIYEVKIPLSKRAKPTDEEPLPVQQSTIDRAIAELNNAVNITTENANKTDSDKIIVSNIKEDVITLKGEIDSTATTINQKAQETINASERAETSARNAATSENNALDYSQQAEQSAQSALESKNIAQQKSEVATNASNEALGYRNEALEAKNRAIQAKQYTVDYRDETKGYRDETLNFKNDVQSLKNQIDETAEEIEDISDSVKEDAQSANQFASSASQSASSANQFANNASQSANSASQSANQAEQYKNQSETNVTHYPKIVDGYWYVWDAGNEEYVNTNVEASGEDGISPTVTITNNETQGTHFIKITDKDGYKTATINDGLTVVMSPSSFVIPTDENGILINNVPLKVTFRAYRAKTPLTLSITNAETITLINPYATEIKGVIWGYTASSTEPYVNATLPSGYKLQGGDSGKFEFTVKVDDKSIVLNSTWALAKRGKDGTNGIDGDDGYSPTANVSKSGKTATITITDKNGTTSAQVSDGEDGATGATPNLTIGTVETLEPTEPATASITGTPENPVLNLGIPQGEQGEVTLEDYYKAFPMDTASGLIASFSDGADDLPIKSLVVNIDPVQDLHGQDSPYPAGGGKNILPYASQDTDSKNGITWTKNSDGSITFSGTCSDSAAMTFVEFKLPAGDYLFSNVGSTFVFTGGNRPIVYIRDLDNSLSLANIGFGQSANGIPFSLSAETNIRFYAVFQTDNVVSGVLYPMIRLSTVTDATFAPYSNLCPISGWTEVDVEQSGVNVWDEEWEVGAYNVSTGLGYEDSTRIRSKNKIPVAPNSTYYTTVRMSLFEYDADGQFISATGSYFGPNATFTVGSNTHYINFQAVAVYGTTYNHDISINYPSTDHDYHPYTGRSITINLGQTVYGGKLDVVTGKLTIEGELEVFDQINDSGAISSGIGAVNMTSGTSIAGDFTRISFSLNSAVRSKYALSSKGYKFKLCNMLPHSYSYNEQSTHWYRNTGLYCFFPTSLVGDTPESVNNYLISIKDTNPLTLWIQYTTPITVQLSANQLNSLYGVNNLWADSGDTEVEYRADTKLFIERLTAPDSADMVADANITSGKYFMVGNSLFKATANIANGGQIVVGTNATRVSLAQALNEINA